MSLKEFEKAIKNLSDTWYDVNTSDEQIADKVESVKREFDAFKKQLQEASEKCKETKDKLYMEEGQIGWTLHGAILGIGLVLGTHSLDTILEMKSEMLRKETNP